MRVQVLKIVGKEYVQVVEDVKRPDGSWTTKVIESFGRATTENIQKAKEFVERETRYENEPNAPKRRFNSTPLDTCLSLVERRLEGLIEAGNPFPAFPRLQYGLYCVGYATLREQIQKYEETKDEKILTRLVFLTQIDLTRKEDVERFVKWLKDKSPEEKLNILSERWYYPKK